MTIHRIITHFRGRGLLADDMGLGKTVQALCAIGGRTLVVGPRSVIHNWMREIERFRPDSWKGYTIGDPLAPSNAKHPWRLDDE